MAAYDPEAKRRFSESVTWLSNVPFPLVDSLEAFKDAPLEFLMSQLVLESERMPGSGEITFGPPVAEERIFPNSLLEKVTSRPRAITTYKDRRTGSMGRHLTSPEQLHLPLPSLLPKQELVPGSGRNLIPLPLLLIRRETMLLNATWSMTTTSCLTLLSSIILKILPRRSLWKSPPLHQCS